MPVLGHAFVGIATAMYTKPATGRSVGLSFWMPTVIGLAYLPDIVHQVGLLFGVAGLRAVSHSVLFAVVVSVPAAVGLAKLASTSVKRAFLVSVISILIHDGLDFLQATDRQPWWPLSTKGIGFDLEIIPVNSLRETVLFGLAFCIFFVCYRLIAKRRDGSVHSGGNVWVARVLSVSLVLAASLTHYQRSVREGNLEQAWTMIKGKDFGAALAVLDQAERWPSTAKPGRLEYARAEAYLKKGDRSQAEANYLRSIAADASYFWAVADLAVFYASSTGLPAERRLRAGPYMRRLQDEFADHDSQPRVLAKLERKLSEATR